MTGSDGTVRFRRSADALSRRVGSDVLVTTVGDGEIHELSGGASAVWRDLDVPLTRAQLVAHLAAEHDVDPSDIAQDVASCLDILRELGVVDREGGRIDG